MGRKPKYYTYQERCDARREQTRQNVRAFRNRQRQGRGLQIECRDDSDRISSPDTDVGEYGDEHWHEQSQLIHVAARPTDFSSYSQLPPIDTSFGVLRSLVHDMYNHGVGKRGPKFPWDHLMKAERHDGAPAKHLDTNSSLVAIGFFALGAMHTSLVHKDEGMKQLALRAQQVLIRTLNKHFVSVGTKRRYLPTCDHDGKDTMALVAANEALFMTYVFEEASKDQQKEELEIRPEDEVAYLIRAGVELMEAAGPLALRNTVGWWILRFKYARMMHMALLDRKACFLDRPAWLDTAFRQTSSYYIKRRNHKDQNPVPGLSIRDDVAEFWRLCARVPRLLENADRLVLKPCTPSRQQAIWDLWFVVDELRVRLDEWWLACRGTFPEQWFAEQDAPRWMVGDKNGLAHVFPTSFWFDSRRTAGTTLVYWMYSLHLILLLEQLRPCLESPLSCAPTENFTIPMTESRSSFSLPVGASKAEVTTPGAAASVLTIGENCARCICSSTQYVVESCDRDPDPGLMFFSDLPYVTLQVAEMFFATQPERYRDELRWIEAAQESTRKRTLLSAAVSRVYIRAEGMKRAESATT